MAYAIGKYGVSTLTSLGSLIALFYVTSALFVFVVLGSVMAYLRLNIWHMLKYLREELLLILGTSTAEPALPGPGWVRVRPLLSGICGSDLATLTGASSLYLSPLVSLPFTLVHEVVGELLDAAPGMPAGTRVVLDPVGGPSFEPLTASMARGGILLEYGALSGEPTPFPLFSVLGKGLTIKGYLYSEIVSDDAALDRAKAFIVAGLESGALKPRIARTFPLDAIQDAHRFLESNDQIGKVVVTV